MYWRFRDLPELQHLSDNERKQLVRSTVNRMAHFWIAVRSVAGGFLLSVVTVMLLQALIKKLIGDHATPIVFFAFPVLLIVLSAATYQMFMIRVRGQMRIYLQGVRRSGEDLPLCLSCGYALKQKVAHCPECGAAA